MLIGTSKNRRRRKRRKKQVTRSLSNSTLHNQHQSESQISPVTEKHPIPILNDEFIRDEVEIETSMLIKRLTKDNELSRKWERENNFFTSATGFENLDLETNDDEDIETNREELLDVLPTPSSIRTTYQYPDDGPQLASSYVNDGDESIVKLHTKFKLELNATELYFPSLNLPKWKHDIEHVGQSDADLADHGHHVYEKPKVMTINRAQMIDRFIEEDSIDWLQSDNNELIGLTAFVQDEKLYKSECLHEFIPKNFPPTAVETTLVSNINDDKILKISIENIVFDQHPAFNKEQKLAREIESLYEQYTARKFNDVVGNVEMKLNVLRQLMANTPRKPSDLTEETFKTYRLELRDLRNRLHRERKTDRDIVTDILNKWQELKKEREGNTPRTTLKLVIKTQDVDPAKDQIDWNYAFNMELNEILQESMDFYREERRKLKNRAKELKANGSDANYDDIPKIQRPDSNVIRQHLYDIYKNSMRPPGEQLVDLELEKFGFISEKNSDKKTIRDLPKYVIRLVLDGVEVGYAETSRLNNNGLALLNTIFSIKFITNVPKELRLTIYEKYKFGNETKIVNMLPSIPIESDIFMNAKLMQLNFQSEPARYVGNIGFKIGWASLTEDNQNLTTISHLPVRSQTTPELKSHQTIESWYNEQIIDPMDPANGILIDSIENKAASGSGGNKKSSVVKRNNVFRLNEDINTFCTKEKFNGNKRIEMLISRFNSDLKLKDCKLIPHTEIEIEIPTDLKIFEDRLWIDPIDVQRYQGKKYLKHVYDVITNHCEVINRDFEYHNLLIGDTPPTFNGIMEAISNIFSPRRPLNPNRRTIQQVRRINFFESHVDRFNIIINVIRASGIPYRNSLGQQTTNRQGSFPASVQNLQRHTNVRPFVTVSFKDKSFKTCTVEGSNPTWNEQIVISISEDMSTIKDSLWFHVYDEIIEDLPTTDDMIAASEIYQKISSHYLGELLIPFSTIYTSQRIEGTFQMSTPIILIGYTKPAVTFPNHSHVESNDTMEVRQPILLSLLISIEPIIEIPQFSMSHLECTELNSIKNHIQLWHEGIKEEFPHRSQDPIITLANGKRVCITRLVGPIDIPFERNETSEYLIRRFVSLIPVRPQKNVCTKLNGIWLTNDQLLNILVASPKDLGVLLTCYYLHLGYTAYLVMGYAIPYGDTTFTLTKEKGDYFFIDPHSGKKYSSRDTFCPLMKVYCIVNNDNVWANIQRENRIFMQNFDTTQSTEWRELFTKSVSAPTELLHDLDLVYTDSLDSENLKKSIELKLMKKITAWRLPRKTLWNKHLRETLLEILKGLEEDQCFEYENKTYMEKINTDFLTKFKVAGFPINMPYVSISNIIERVKATGIHINSDAKVEFSLSVYIQSYPMNIFSIWVFVLALSPNNY